MRTVDRNGRVRLAGWSIALTAFAVTMVAYRWAPEWAGRMHTVSLGVAPIAIIWLWAPACGRWLTRHRNRTA